MTADRIEAPPLRFAGLIGLAAVAAAIAAAMTAQTLAARLPSDLWWQAVTAPDLADPRQFLVHFAVLPRIVTCWLCGASLALAGTLLQQALQNPLVEPGTLGLSSGAFLALTIALVLLPDLGRLGQEAVAMIGSGLVAILVFGLMLARQLAPIPLLLAGMIAGMTCAALASCALLFANPYDTSLFLWGAGSLSQNDWSAVSLLWPQLALCAAVAVLLARPLDVMGLDAASARSLGLNVFGVRAAALAVATVLTASVTAAVGVIGFVGLAAPALAGMMGARRFAQRLLWAPPVGALLLWFSDQFVIVSSSLDREWIPTGAATALAGTPLLLWLAARSRMRREAPRAASWMQAARGRPLRLVAGFYVLLALSVVVSLFFGNGVHGWHWSDTAQMLELSPWRAPRLFGAIAAGAMLAVTGVLMQRLTGNAMAGPEVLGVGSGAALGMIALAFVAPAMSGVAQFIASACGAGSVLLVMAAMSRSAAFDPDRLLLVGIALAAFLNVAAVAVMATGNPNVVALRIWLSGSTQFVMRDQAALAIGLALALIGISLLAGRWLELLSLGGSTGQALGLNIAKARLAILLLAACLTAAAVLIVGPLGFVGLMSPHLARMAGLRRAGAELLGAALLGALIMALADWAGRNLLFPYQLPAGLVATFIGGPYFMWLMRKSGQ